MASTTPSEHAPTTLPGAWPVPGHDAVLLVPPAPRHVPSIVAACNDPDVQHFTRVPHPYGTTEAEGYVALAAQEHAAGTGLVVVLERAPDEVLGTVGLFVDRRDHRAELGYWTAPAGRGRGLTTAAVREVLRHGLATLGVAVVHAEAAAGNAASLAVLARVGMRRVGTLRRAGLLGPMGAPGGERSDMVLHDLLPDELA